MHPRHAWEAGLLSVAPVSALPQSQLHPETLWPWPRQPARQCCTFDAVHGMQGADAAAGSWLAAAAIQVTYSTLTSALRDTCNMCARLPVQGRLQTAMECWAPCFKLSLWQCSHNGVTWCACKSQTIQCDTTVPLQFTVPSSLYSAQAAPALSVSSRCRFGYGVTVRSRS